MSLNLLSDEELSNQITERQQILDGRQASRELQALREDIASKGYVLSWQALNHTGDLRHTTLRVHARFAAGTPEGEAMILSKIHEAKWANHLGLDLDDELRYLDLESRCDTDFEESFRLYEDLDVGDFTHAFRADGWLMAHFYTLPPEELKEGTYHAIIDGEYELVTLKDGQVSGKYSSTINDLSDDITLIPQLKVSSPTPEAVSHDA